MPHQRRVVLFQGDSITDGGRGRSADPNHILGRGYAYSIAARLGFELAERAPTFINRGVSGDRVSDLYARWNEDFFSLKPTLLSVLIGVNDAWRIVNNEPTGATDRFERAYTLLLEETRDKSPGTGIVIMEPFILNAGAPAANWDVWRAKLFEYQVTARRLADRFDAAFVPLQEPFERACARAEPSYWLWDGVHPTAAGHELIAREWLSVVQSSRLAIR